MSRMIGVLTNHSDLSFEFVDESTGSSYMFTPEQLPEGIQYNYRIWLDVGSQEWGRMDEIAGSLVREKKHILLLRTCSTGASESTKTRLLKEVIRNGRELQNFYRHYASDIWDVRVHADLVESTQAPWNTNWHAALFRDYMKTLKLTEFGAVPEEFDPNYFHCWSHYGHGSYCGLGQLYNKYSWTQASCGLHTIIHELGHNFGLHHAQEGGAEYGDKTCVMGAGGANVPGLNAPHMAKIRVKARRPFANVNESGWIVLAPMETHDHALHPEEVLLAEVNNRDKRVWLSIRRHAGAQYNFGAPYEDKINVHTKTSDGKTQLVEDIRPGETFRLPNGPTVYYINWNKEARRATAFISYNGDPVVGEPVEPRTRWPVPSYARVLEPTEHPQLYGQWYSPAHLGQGISVNADAAHFYTFEPGEVSTPRYTPKWLRLNKDEFCWHHIDNNNAILLIDREETGRDALELKRLSLPAASSGMIRDASGWTIDMHYQIPSTPAQPKPETVILFAKDTGAWYYGQDGIIYRAQGRWLQTSDLVLDKVGTYTLTATAIGANVLEFTVLNASYKIMV